MKFNKHVSSSRRKSRKRHFNAPSHIRRRIMSSRLSKELRAKFKVRTMPIHVGDEVQIVRGERKDSTIHRVARVYRKRYVLHMERVQSRKCNGSYAYVGVHPSNVSFKFSIMQYFQVVITRMKLNKDRRDLMARKSAGKLAGTDKNKYTEETIES